MKPVEQRRAGAANMKISRGRRSETDACGGSHLVWILAAHRAAATGELLDEKFPGPAAGMPVVRQIRLGFPRIRIEKRAHPLNRFEIQIRHIA